MSRKISLTTNSLDNIQIETSMLDGDEDSFYPILERLRTVENTPREIPLRIPTRGEWLLYWGKRGGLASRHPKQRPRKSLKEYVSGVQKPIFVVK